MPLARDVNMAHLAEITHGFVGADLEALCREAAMIRLRRILPEIDFALASIPYEQLAKLEVRDGRLRGRLARSRALGHARGVRRSAQCHAGRTWAA